MSKQITLWTASADGLAYSLDWGATWTEVSTAPIFSGGIVNALWGPRDSWKIYVLYGPNFGGQGGIWYYDETGWHSELIGFNTEPIYSTWPTRRGIWCNEDDTYVVHVHKGIIRERDGAPGTSWTETVVYFPGSWWEGFYDVHGNPDGSAVYAAYSETQLYRKDPTTGVWARATLVPSYRLHCVRVVSDTEVWICGQGNTGGLGRSGNIWKWDGATLTEEFVKSDPFGTTRITSLYMEDDGSAGWAIWHNNNDLSFLQYNGSVWSEVQAADFGSRPTEITQLAGDLPSARLVLDDSILVAYDGATWSVLPTSFPISGDFLSLQYLGPDLTPEPPATVQERPAYGLQRYGSSSLYGKSFTDGPLIQNQDPAPDSVDNSVDTPIETEVNGILYPTDPATVVIRVNGVIAWESDSPQNGYTGYKTNSMNGFRYHLEAPGSFQNYSQVVIEIDAKDTNGSAIT